MVAFVFAKTQQIQCLLNRPHLTNGFRKTQWYICETTALSGIYFQSTSTRVDFIPLSTIVGITWTWTSCNSLLTEI